MTNDLLLDRLSRLSIGDYANELREYQRRVRLEWRILLARVSAKSLPPDPVHVVFRRSQRYSSLGMPSQPPEITNQPAGLDPGVSVTSIDATWYGKNPVERWDEIAKTAPAYLRSARSG